jgi:hypothetical protein
MRHTKENVKKLNRALNKVQIDLKNPSYAKTKDLNEKIKILAKNTAITEGVLRQIIQWRKEKS